MRERVGVLDLSAFAKYDVTGRGAAAFLDRLCANRVPRRRGGVVLAHMLGEPGGIECEATISRLGDERFFVLSGATAELHDLDWMAWHIGDGEEVEIANRTADYACLVLTGPRARDVLGALHLGRPRQRGVPLDERARDRGGGGCRYGPCACPTWASSAGSCIIPWRAWNPSTTL